MPDLLEGLRETLADRYIIDREIGRGGNAVVYVAHDKKHARKVAIKVLLPGLPHSIRAERFLREIQIAAKLNHPHILALHDSGQVNGLLYYVMPYVGGETLRDRLRREKQLPLADALQIAREVADALSYAHRHDVVHRDIKPENILLEEGHAVVADFGIARALTVASGQTVTQTGVVLGTPVYMSPEQGGGSQDLDGRSDIYSLGCVAYEMLAGQPPFTGKLPQEILAHHVLDPVPPLRTLRPTVPAPVEAAIAIAVAKNPADRFATAAEFAHALANPTSARIESIRSGWRTPPRSWPAKRAWWMAVAAASVALLAIAALLERRPRPSAPSAAIDIVILPFEDATPAGGSQPTSRTDAHLLLADALEWIPGVQAIDGNRLLRAGQSWRAVPLPELFRGARSLAGKYLVTGTLHPTAGGSRVTAELYTVSDGQRVARGDETVEGDNLDAPLARLAFQLVVVLGSRERLFWGSQEVLLTATSSAVALGRLLQGQTRFWSGDLDGAAAAFRAAVESDSACGLAYHRWGVAETWRHDQPAAMAAVAAALARSPSLAPRWTDLVQAQRYYVLGDGDSAIAAFQKTVQDHPAEIDGWLGLGEALFHFAGFTGHSLLDADPALERVAALDSAFAPIYSHLVDLALYDRDVAKGRRYLSRIRADDPTRPAREAAVAIWSGSPASRADALRRLQAADRYTLSELMILLMHESYDLPLADTVATYLVGPGRTPDDRLRGAEYRLVALAGQGQWAQAVAAWKAAAGTPRFDGWLLQAYFAGYPAAELAKPMFQWARSLVADRRTPNFALPPWDERQQAFQALVHRATVEGDSAEVLELLGRLSAARPPATSTDPLPGSMRASLDARLALLARDTSRAIGLLERSVSRSAELLVTFFPLTAFASQRSLLAKLLARKGDVAQSRRWLDSFSNSRSLGDVFFAAQVKQRRAVLGR